MIKSMTGFGRCEREFNGIPILVEIRTVNNRFFDYSLKTTRGYGFLEEKLKNHIQGSVSRGKVEVYVTIGVNNEAPCTVLVNESLAKGYIDALNSLKEQFNLSGEVSVSLVSRFPDVFTVRKAAEDEEMIWSYVKEACDEALSGLISMREQEGERLRSDILDKCAYIMKMVQLIDEKTPQTVNNYRNRLEEKVRALLENKTFDDQRILTEVAIFADKITVDEESVRLRSHLAQVKKLLSLSEPVGRRLDFLVQEMNRETNTIGSKATNSEIAHIVVSIKAEIEKIREQIQNIE